MSQMPEESQRLVFMRDLERKIAPRVWQGMAGNGGLVIHIDTDVDCYGDWEPNAARKGDGTDQVTDAQHWVAGLVMSTINRLIDVGYLRVPEEDE